MPGGGSKPGERRGGRQKGTPNKNRTNFLELMHEACKRHDVDPVATVAAELKNDDPEIRIKAARILMDHAYPKPKAVEHSGAIDLGAAFLEALKRA